MRPTPTSNRAGTDLEIGLPAATHSVAGDTSLTEPNLVITRNARAPTLPPTPTRHAPHPQAAPRGVDAKQGLRGLDFDAQEAALAPVQMRGGDPASQTSGVQQAASRGIAGGGANLPYLDRIQAAFGAHDVSDVRAHQGSAASGAAKQMGAMAYATGNNVVFGQSPDLFTAAHEAAHVVQQRKGVQLSGNVGRAGDAYEQHADQVAARVVAGRSAEDLLGGTAHKGAVQAQRGLVQRREEPVNGIDKCSKKDTLACAVGLAKAACAPIPGLLALSQKQVDETLSLARDYAKGKKGVERAIDAERAAKPPAISGILGFLSAFISFTGAVQAGIGAILLIGKGVAAAGAGTKALGAAGGALSGTQGLRGVTAANANANPAVDADEALSAQDDVLMKAVQSNGAITSSLLTVLLSANLEELPVRLAIVQSELRKSLDPVMRAWAIEEVAQMGRTIEAAECDARQLSRLVEATHVVGQEALAPGEKARTLFDHVWGVDRKQPHNLELANVKTLETDIDPMNGFEIRTTTVSEPTLTFPSPLEPG